MLPWLVLLATPVQAPNVARLEGSVPAILPDLVQRWTSGFVRRHPGEIVTVAPPFGPPQGSMSPSLAAFLAGELDFAFLTRKLADRDRTIFRERHGHDPLVIPVAGGSWRSFGFVDPVVVVVNARNPVRGLSFAQLRALYADSPARPEEWSALGVRGWARRPIHVLGPSPGQEDSARAGAFRERVMDDAAWRASGLVAVAEAEIPARIASDPLAIGFTGLGHVLPGTRVVPLARSDNGRFVAPSLAAVASGRYPLARTVDLVVDRPPGTCLRPDLLRFIRYLLGPDGQAAVRAEGHFLPLTRAQARLSWRRASACDQKRKRPVRVR